MYEIIKDSDLDRFQQAVNDAIRGGAVLQGGVCLSKTPETREAYPKTVWTQAVIFYPVNDTTAEVLDDVQ